MITSFADVFLSISIIIFYEVILGICGVLYLWRHI